MCNRVVQKGKVIKPGEKITVLMKGPGAEFELTFDGAVFGGPAKSESRGYWLKRERAEPVIIPDVSRYGEKNKTTEEQGWEDVQPGSSLEGLCAAAATTRQGLSAIESCHAARYTDQIARLGNDRAPVVVPPKAPSD